MRLTLLAAAAAALAACGNANAQEWRTLDVTRQLHDLPSGLTAEITYGAGTLTLGPASGPDLYEMHLRYPAGRTAPVASYNPNGHSVHLGIKSQNFSMPGGDVDQNTLHIGLARGVPLDLTTEVGAADVKMDLGGLTVRRLALKTGAADVTLAYSLPNTTHMESMVLNVGAAGFKATGLANAHADHIVLRAGVGQWDLYFDGTWTGDITLDAKIGLGSLTVHVPDDVRVEQNAKAVLGDVSGDRGHIDFSDSADTEDQADTSDDDTSDEASASAKATAAASAKAAAVGAAKAAKALKTASPVIVNTNTVTVVKVKGTTPTPPHFTLHIVGSATLGEIAVDHKLPSEDGQ